MTSSNYYSKNMDNNSSLSVSAKKEVSPSKINSSKLKHNYKPSSVMSTNMSTPSSIPTKINSKKSSKIKKIKLLPALYKL